MKLYRLQGRKTNDYVLRRGKVWKGKTFQAYIVPGAPKRDDNPAVPGLYTGTFAPARLHKSAVVRNRMRRRIREALRIAVQNIDQLPSAQLLLCPRSASLSVPFEDIQQDVQNFLSHLTWQPPKNHSASGTSL